MFALTGPVSSPNRFGEGGAVREGMWGGSIARMRRGSAPNWFGEGEWATRSLQVPLRPTVRRTVLLGRGLLGVAYRVGGLPTDILDGQPPN
ncbi:hypothetical protein GCM10009745_80700 [Kribbella yunnanensis]|uniref:Uncharacterized protein n=1 Tax=Kribbella yunnanensis TaxID=190194 RepID=A0ABN2J7I8_9ACTN